MSKLILIYTSTYLKYYCVYVDYNYLENIIYVRFS